MERQRALQRTLDQQDLLSSGAAAVPGTHVIQGAVSGGPVRSEDNLSQVPFGSSQSGLDFLPSSSAPRHPQQVQVSAGGPFHPQPSLHQSFTGGSLPPRGAAPTLQSRPRQLGLVRPHLFGQDSSSLISVSSDLIPDDQLKKNARTPLSPHSDITAPPTPAVSDKSTPTHQSDTSFSGLAPSPDLERQLTVSSAAHQSGSVLGREPQRGPLSGAGLEVKVSGFIIYHISTLL